MFSEADFAALSELLGAIEGRFILSINDTAGIRTIFDRYAIEPADVSYRVSGRVTAARELIISGPCRR